MSMAGTRRPADDDEDTAPLTAPKRRRAGSADDHDGVNGNLAQGAAQQSATADRGDAAAGSDSDDDLAPHLARVLADSDAESSSSSSSDDEDGKKGKGKGPAAVPKAGSKDEAGPGTPDKPAAADAAEGGTEGAKDGSTEGAKEGAKEGAVAPASPSSDSSSSSSSDSESESDNEALVGGAPDDASMVGDRPAGLAAQETQVVEVSQYDAVRRAILKRDEVARLLSGLPLEVAEDAVVRCYVRLAVQAGQKDQDNTACVLAEVVGLESSPPYVVTRSDGQRMTLKLRLRCKRGSSHRLVKISSVSNRELTEFELEQWQKLIERTGIEPRIFTDQMMKKAKDIHAARNFKFDDTTVSKMLDRKGSLEFDAQKESRMRFLVQSAISQMDISGIRDNEARELEQRYKDHLDQLRMQDAKSTEVQAEWFEKRANLFSLKMINKKNYERQVADDKHALEFTLANENAGLEGLNPFQRRACRPLVAWDTQLTAAEGLPTNKPSAAEAAPEKAAEAKAAAPAAAAPGKTSSAESADAAADGAVAEGGEAPINERQRMERFVRAHSGARHILAGLGGSRS